MGEQNHRPEQEELSVLEAPHRSAAACRISELCIADLHLEAIVRQEQLATAQAEREFYKLAFTESAVQIGKLASQLSTVRQQRHQPHVNSPRLEATMDATTHGYVFVRDQQMYHTDKDTYDLLRAVRQWEAHSGQDLTVQVFEHGRTTGLIREGAPGHEQEGNHNASDRLIDQAQSSWVTHHGATPAVAPSRETWERPDFKETVAEHLDDMVDVQQRDWRYEMGYERVYPDKLHDEPEQIEHTNDRTLLANGASQDGADHGRGGHSIEQESDNGYAY